MKYQLRIKNGEIKDPAGGSLGRRRNSLVGLYLLMRKMNESIESRIPSIQNEKQLSRIHQAIDGRVGAVSAY